MKCYKVVEEEDGKYYSAIIKGKYRLEYPPNKWIKPKIGKIFAFDNLTDTEEYTKANPDFKVFLAEAKGEIIKGGFRLATRFLDASSIKLFWTYDDFVKNDDLDIFIDYNVKGIILVDKIMLLEEV